MMNAEIPAVWSSRASPSKWRSRGQALPQWCDSYIKAVFPPAVNKSGGPATVQMRAPYPSVRLGPTWTSQRFGVVERIQSP